MMAITCEKERSPAQPGDRELAIIRDLLRTVSGIEVREGQEGLIASRLGGRLAACGLSLGEYLDRLGTGRDLEELGRMVDALTTGHSTFFRHPAHFSRVVEHLAGRSGSQSTWEVWSAGCSSGEEPYSLAMAVADARAAGRPIAEGTILATDISSSALESAKKGCFPASSAAGLEEETRRRHFDFTLSASSGLLRVDEAVRRAVRFETRNLVGAWHDEARFAAIFCRNVMIYFDPPSRRRLISRLVDALEPGGLLCLSPVESAGVDDPGLETMAPAVFRKKRSSPWDDPGSLEGAGS